MKKYLSLMICSMQNAIAYRTAFLGNLLFNFIFIISYYYLWRSIFSDNNILNGFTWEQMKTYLLVTFVANNLVSQNSEYQISRRINNGFVIVDMLRPISFQKASFAQTIGASLFEGLFGAFIIGTALKYILNIEVPIDASLWILFLISLITSLFVRFCIVYIFGLISFWTTSVQGVIAARIALTNLLSGTLIPLSFFPHWLQELSMLLPFSSIVHTPATIFLGKKTIYEATMDISLQILWFAILWVIGKYMWKWASRQLTVNGG